MEMTEDTIMEGNRTIPDQTGNGFDLVQVAAYQPKPKLLDLPKQNKDKAALEALERSMPELIKGARLLAQLKRAYFESYIEQGFNEAQALELCKQ